MRGPPLHMLRDTLTVEIVSEGHPDPLTGAGEERTVREVVRQPCSDQDASLKSRTPAIVAGVSGALPVSLCYTRWFPWPDVSVDDTLVVRVNGRARPLMKQGPPVDIGGQHGMMLLELGSPTDQEAR